MTGINSSDPERPVSSEKHEEPAPKVNRLHEFNESEGYVVDVEEASAETGIKVAKDGRTVLVPQPSDDPNDPLNWLWKKKHLTLFVIALASFLPDFGSAIGAVTLIPQALYVTTSTS